MNDLEFDLSGSLKVKSHGAVGMVGPPIYDFLLVPDSNHIPVCISYHLRVIVT